MNQPIGGSSGLAASRAAGGAYVPDVELDCRGLLCPLPVYRASQAIGKLAPGQVLRVECTDPGSLADFPALARQRGLTLLSAEEWDGVQVFRLRLGEEQAG
jgi:tRNA 2-thiouridine synthesizing protein A